MQRTSATYDRIRLAPDKQYYTRILINGVAYGEDQIISLSTDIQLFNSTSEVGKAVAGEIDVVMLAPNVTIPPMASVQPQIQAKGTAPKSSAVTITNEVLSSTYASYASSKITFASGSGATVSGETLNFPVDATEYLTSEWIPQGCYFIDTRETTANNDGINVLSIHGFDAMLKAEQDFSNQVLPDDDVHVVVVERIASIMGVQIDPRTYDIMTSRYPVAFNIAYSLREFLAYIASMYAGNFMFTDEGKLRLVGMTGLPVQTNLLVDNVGDVILFGGDAILI